ncbi:hypothetical protein STIAU_6913, partial [Stigmatella aurantiaca DW4/3-1]
MAKPKSGAKKATPAPKKDNAARLELLKSASKRVAKVATKVAKAVKDVKDKVTKSAKAKTPAKASPEKSVDKPAKGASEKPPAKAKTASAKTAAAKNPAEAPPKDKVKASSSKGGKAAAAPPPPAQERPRPRATKLPPVGEPLTKRETEQLLTAGEGRGVMGEGSLKGRLVVSDGMPHLVVVGRDKRELTFLLQGPDQEVLPAYVEHKVSVSGLIRKLTNYGGTVDVRKYSAK